MSKRERVDGMRFLTDRRSVFLTAAGVTLGMSVLAKKRFYPKTEIAAIDCGTSKRYMTGSRAAGAVLTGGLALLAPPRREGYVAVVLTTGKVIKLDVTGSRTQKLGAFEAYARSLGYET